MTHDELAAICGRVQGSYSGGGWRQAMVDMGKLLDEVRALRKWVQLYSECDCDTRTKPGQPHWFACRRALADKLLWPDGNVQREVEPLVDQLEQSNRLVGELQKVLELACFGSKRNRPCYVCGTDPNASHYDDSPCSILNKMKKRNDAIPVPPAKKWASDGMAPGGPHDVG